MDHLGSLFTNFSNKIRFKLKYIYMCWTYFLALFLGLRNWSQQCVLEICSLYANNKVSVEFMQQKKSKLPNRWTNLKQFKILFVADWDGDSVKNITCFLPEKQYYDSKGAPYQPICPYKQNKGWGFSFLFLINDWLRQQ